MLLRCLQKVVMSLCIPRLLVVSALHPCLMVVFLRSLSMLTLGASSLARCHV